MKPRQKLTFLLIGLLIITSLISACSPVTAATAPAVPPTAALSKVEAPKSAFDLNAGIAGFVTSLPDGYFGIKNTDALMALQSDPKPYVIDLREPKEITQTNESSVNIPVRSLLKNLDKLPAKDSPILVYCAVLVIVAAWPRHCCRCWVTRMSRASAAIKRLD